MVERPPRSSAIRHFVHLFAHPAAACKAIARSKTLQSLLCGGYTLFFVSSTAISLPITLAETVAGSFHLSTKASYDGRVEHYSIDPIVNLL